MTLLRLTIFLCSAILLIGWRTLFEPLGFSFFPLGALAVFPLVYYRWFSTLLFVLVLGLLWECTTPMPFGSVALPLAVGTVLLQLFARHQFRANFITKIFCGCILQSIVTLSIGFKFPPQTFAGVLLQLFETILQLAGTALICPIWFYAMEKLARERFGINLESSLKDL